jgi:hypothetical protein
MRILDASLLPDQSFDGGGEVKIKIDHAEQ